MPSATGQTQVHIIFEIQEPLRLSLSAHLVTEHSGRAPWMTVSSESKETRRSSRGTRQETWKRRARVQEEQNYWIQVQIHVGIK